MNVLAARLSIYGYIVTVFSYNENIPVQVDLINLYITRGG